MSTVHEAAERFRALTGVAVTVFGLDEEVAAETLDEMRIGALLARDMRCAQVTADGVDWHVAVLTGKAARELDAQVWLVRDVLMGGTAKIGRRGELPLDGAWWWLPRDPIGSDFMRWKLMVSSEDVPDAICAKLAEALHEEIARGEASQA